MPRRDRYPFFLSFCTFPFWPFLTPLLSFAWTPGELALRANRPSAEDLPYTVSLGRLSSFSASHCPFLFSSSRNGMILRIRTYTEGTFWREDPWNPLPPFFSASLGVSFAPLSFSLFYLCSVILPTFKDRLFPLRWPDFAHQSYFFLPWESAPPFSPLSYL